MCGRHVRMIPTLDHVTIGGLDLAGMEQAFRDIGLESVYGGEHSNERTHMAIIGFDDGTYVELISTRPGITESPVWHTHIISNGGPCGWGIRVDEFTALLESARSAGVRVEDPVVMNRHRPDSTVLEWELAFLGEEGHETPGAVFPFLIRDLTHRELRTRTTVSSAETGLTGVEKVMIGVQDAAEVVAQFRSVFRLSAPLTVELSTVSGSVTSFPGTPMAFVSPVRQNSWIAQRLEKFGQCPCGYLLGTEDFERSNEALDLGNREEWGDRLASFFEPQPLQTGILGVLER